jgi:hypothetical protein
MPLPKIQLKPCCSGCMQIAPDYTDLTRMMTDIIEGVKEYPEGSLLLVEDPPRKRWGYYLEIVEKDLWRRWEFYIGLDDYQNTLDAFLKSYPEYSRDDFQTRGRALLAYKLLETAHR